MRYLHFGVAIVDLRHRVPARTLGPRKLVRAECIECHKSVVLGILIVTFNMYHVLDGFLKNAHLLRVLFYG